MAGEDLVNVKDPDTGEIGSIPRAQLAQAQQQGFAPASHEEAQLFVRGQKYGGLGQQALTGLEGAASAATFGTAPLLEDIAGRAFNSPNLRTKAQLERREENPLTHGGGQGVGLIAPLLVTGGTSAGVEGAALGAQGIMESAGMGAAKAIGLGSEAAIHSAAIKAAQAATEAGLSSAKIAEAATAAGKAAANEFSTVSKIGSAATKGAIENMLFQAGDQVSKGISQEEINDPKSFLETSAAHVGLAGLMGGAIGGAGSGVSTLWKATNGGRIGSLLKAIADHGGAADLPLNPEIASAIETSGVQVPGEIKAALSESPFARESAKILEQSDTSSAGKKFQQTLQGFKKDSSDAVLGALGKTADTVDTEFSAFDKGKEIQDTLRGELKSKIEPIAKNFENIRNEFKGVEISPDMKGQIGEDIAKMATERGYSISPSSIQAKEINRILNELPGLKTLEDLRKFQSVVGENMNSPELYGLGKSLKGIFRENESNILERAFAEKNPELAESLSAGIKQARGDYAKAAGVVEDLNDRLRAGRYSSPSSYERVVGEMAPEDLLKRLGSKNDVGLLETLETHFPETAAKVRQSQLDLLVKEAASKAGPDQAINASKVFSSLEKMSPEYRKFLLSEESMNKIGAVKTLLDRYNEMPHNFSNTARTLDKLNQYVVPTATGMAAMVMGHNPALAFLVGGLTKAVSKDAPDAVRLALLKFMSSDKAIEPTAFKAMADYISSTIKGETVINKAADAIFKAGKEVIPSKLLPDEKRLDKLDKKITDLHANMNPLFEAGDQVGHYMPAHAEAIGGLAGNAVAYLHSLKPQNTPSNPLDDEIPPTKFQMENYRSALKIAESPVSILQHVKDGSIDSDDITHLNSLYPSLYQKLSQKLMDNMITAKSNGVEIPYKTKMGLSLFLGQPLDSTMTPQSIQALQIAQMGPQSQQQAQQQMPGSGGHNSLKDIGKIASNSATPDQARVKDKMQGTA